MLKDKPLIRVIFSFALFSIFFATVSGTVAGIDFGSEWFKVALVRGKTFEVVLNEQSSRKTPTAIAFTEDLLVGADAKNLATRSPQKTILYAQQLLGRSPSDPFLTQNADFLPLNAIPHPNNTNTLAFTVGNEVYSVETVGGFMFERAKDIAKKTAETEVKDCVITVPPFFNQNQRQAVVDAAKLGGLNVLAMISDNTAAAVNWALERDFEATPTKAIFFDMGGSSTKVSLIHFTGTPDEKNKNKTITHVHVMDVAWDDSLGGRNFDYVIAQIFAKEVEAKTKTRVTPKDHPKPWAKLMREAQKAKEILSANQEVRSSVEGLFPDYDYVTTITREQFENAARPLFERAFAPLKELLKRNDITNVSDIGYVEIYGGGVRIPKFQQKLAEVMGRKEVDKHLNTDESSVLGASFYAATMSSSFRVRPIKVKEFSPFGVQVTLQTDDKSEKKDTVLFNSGAKLGSKKSISFNFDQNFTVDLEYTKSSSLPTGTNKKIGKYQVLGVPTHENHNFTGTPKITTHFRVNSKGMFEVEKAEAEITVTQIITIPKKVNKTIEIPETPKETKEETEASENAEEQTPSESENASEAQEEPQTEKAEKTEEAAPIVEEVETKEVKRNHKVKLTITPIEAPGLSDVQYYQNLFIIREIRRKIDLRKEKEREKNALESYTYEYREKLDNGDFEQVATSEEREQFSEALSEAGNWLYEEGSDAETAQYRTKYNALKAKGDKFNKRIFEQKERPTAISQFFVYVNFSREFISNLTETHNITETEVQEFFALLALAENDITQKAAAQAALPANVDPILTTDELTRKVKELDVKVRIFSRKPRKVIKKEEPKPVETEETASEETNENPTQDEVPEGEQERKDEL